MKKLILVLFLVITCVGLKAQITWEDARGIYPLNVNTIAINSNGEIFGGRDTGSVIYSNNNGVDWSYRSINDSAGKVTDLKIAPNGNVFAACYPLTATDNHNLYKSVDTGKTWIALPFFSHFIRDFNIDPSGTLYTIIDSSSNPDKVLFTSTDNGNTWSLISMPVGSWGWDKISLTGSGELFAYSYYSSVFSFDNGVTWNSDPAAPFSCVAKDPITGTYLYGYSSASGSSYEYNEVTQWLPTLVQNGGLSALVDGVVDEIFFTPSGDKVLISHVGGGASYNYTFQAAGSSTWLSSPGTDIADGCALNPVSNLMFVARHEPFGGGSSPPGIYTWDVYGAGAIAGKTTNYFYSNYVYASIGSRDIYARTTSNYYCSSNNGTSWKVMDDVFGVPGPGYTYEFYSNPYSGDNFIVAEDVGYSGYLYRKTYHSNVWQMIWIDSIISKMAFTPSGKLFVIQPWSRKLSVSSDNGINWNSLYTLPLWGPGAIDPYGFTTTKAGSLLITYVSAGQSYALRSTDEGLSWSASGLYANKYFRSPHANDVYAFGYPSSVVAYPDGIYKSSDDGITWTQLVADTTFYPPGGNVFKDMVITSCGDLYVTTNLGLFLSADDGATWTLQNSYSAPGTLVMNADGYLFTAGAYVQRSTTPLSSVDSCNLVWPGDADNGLSVDNQDILQLGLYYGSTGSSRASISNNWEGFSSVNWGTLQYNGQDIKSVDCNGDGIVNDSDTLAINQNYSFVHTRSQTPQIKPASAPDLFFVTAATDYAPGQIIDVEIWAGTNAAPVSNLYGLSFDVNVDQSLLIPSFSQILYDSCWLGNAIVSLSHVSEAAINGAVCRINHLDSTGYGKIGDLYIQSDPAITTYSNLILSFEGYKAIDHLGNQILLNTLSDTLHIDPLLTGVSEAVAFGGFDVYPNPVNDQMTVVYKISEPSDVKIEVVNYLGQKMQSAVIKDQAAGEYKYNLALDDKYSQGVYFVRAVINGVSNVKRIVKL